MQNIYLVSLNRNCFFTVVILECKTVIYKPKKTSRLVHCTTNQFFYLSDYLR
uniref:Uncharacterized protein n=1 Tax=Kuenenia stuttgartiensis TaxID=174633 RepID=Q1Q476_KUEST|nr:unknown protein [Candidatus Kuenenia stuttgartiensis]